MQNPWSTSSLHSTEECFKCRGEAEATFAPLTVKGQWLKFYMGLGDMRLYSSIRVGFQDLNRPCGTDNCRHPFWGLYLPTLDGQIP